MNMSYCRFQNTSTDLRDCLNNLRTLDPADNGYNAEEERIGRGQIIRMAAQLLEELGIEDPSDVHTLEDTIESLDSGEGYGEEDESQGVYADKMWT